VTLSDDEARDLVKTILEAIEAAEEGTQVRASWSLEATDWCYLLLDRLGEGDLPLGRRTPKATSAEP